MRSKAFTLLEILVVLGIVLILIAISAPKFQDAIVRSRVVVARAHTRSIANALDLYAVDHREYPHSLAHIPEDPLGILSVYQLATLTSPTGYLSSDVFLDPFGVIEPQVYDPSLTAGNDFPRLGQPNDRSSLLYFYYPSLAVRKEEPSLNLLGAAAISIGPDRIDSMGAYRPFSAPFFAARIPAPFPQHPYDTVYGPTNGARSKGDIGGYAGDARRFAVP